ncbi:hypothetical protein [Tenacibaculum jejuense]|uniref:Uncharacterized protein n=1 Tax=Tenacibaculum jejuense TaxID=584609 RepID=A0A238UAS4_9FLAO|nr:hypothetical protein [Tenacibaculum jejuense]SNR16192.1 Protein of unknown function [Tenacibaculum jejuense]
MKNLLNVNGVSVLTKKDQKTLNGGIVLINAKYCECDCSGKVSGPKYCEQIISCSQEYNCNQ